MFTEKTIKRLKEIGLKESKGDVAKVYRNESDSVEVYIPLFGPYNPRIYVSVHTFQTSPCLGKPHHTIRYETLKALKLAERAEEIIKENGK